MSAEVPQLAALRGNTVVNQTTRERALALTQAANEIGAKVVAIANEGERFTTMPRRGRGQEVTVSPGNIAIRESGQFPGGDMGAFHARADEIYQQMQDQQTPNPHVE